MLAEDAVNKDNANGLVQPKKRKRSNESEPIIICPTEHYQILADAYIWWHSGDSCSPYY